MKYFIFVLLVIMVLCGCEHPGDYIYEKHEITQDIISGTFQDVKINMLYSYTGYQAPRLIEFHYEITTVNNTYSLYDELSFFIGTTNLSYSVNVNNEEMIDYSIYLITHKY